MNIYDCFMYYDEDMLLDLRLHVLDKNVKKFVITEATYTHNGSKKDLQFDINKFKKFRDKINYIIVDKPPPNLLQIYDDDLPEKKAEKLILNGYARDNFQRENLSKGLNKSEDGDLIIVSDLDEIPNLDETNLNNIKEKLIIFKQKMFYYKLNLLYDEFNWYGSKACRKKDFLSPQWLRNIKSKKYSKFRIDLFFSKKKYSDIYHINNGGWHFTCMRTPENLEKKLLNFAHHFEFEESGLKVNDLKKLIEEKRVMYDHNIDQRGYKWSGKSKLKKINKDFLPNYIVENKIKYKEWLD
jgi:beta-1,4-mannosyl-glycoprotein beta-1,4-N-acetylglucosaminyltransferase